MDLCIDRRRSEVFFLCFAILTACGQGEHQEAEAGRDASHEDAAHEIHWGYEEESGPVNWADLGPEFTLCGKGTEQSPIDQAGAQVGEGAALARKLG